MAAHETPPQPPSSPPRPHSPGPLGPVSGGRIVAIDGVRAWAMFLGVALHAALAFTRADTGFCPRMDASRWLGFDVFVLGTHAFRMQLFFLIAGYFASLLVARRGVAAFVRNRLLRIALPLALGSLVLVPLVRLPFVMALPFATQSGEAPDPASWRATQTALVWDYHNPAHLWFLLYLLALSAAAIGLRRVVALVPRRGVVQACERVVARALTAPWGVLALALPAIAMNLLMPRWPVTTADSWVPDPVVLGYYFVFFACGWVMHSRGVEIAAVGRRWAVLLGVGLLVLLPLLIVVGVSGLAAIGERVSALGLPARLALVPAVVVQGLFTWCMILGTLGLFMRMLRSGGRVVAYLSDAAYWVYLVHLPLVYMLQVQLHGWDVPAAVKYPTILLITVAVCLATYQVLVRHTLVGRVLNGARVKSVA